MVKFGVRLGKIRERGRYCEEMVNADIGDIMCGIPAGGDGAGECGTGRRDAGRRERGKYRGT